MEYPSIITTTVIVGLKEGQPFLKFWINQTKHRLKSHRQKNHKDLYLINSPNVSNRINVAQIFADRRSDLRGESA